MNTTAARTTTAFALPPPLPSAPRRPRLRPRPRHHPICQTSPQSPATPAAARTELLSLLSRADTPRTGNDAKIAALVTRIESTAAPSASDARLLGAWRNAYTSLPRSASPLQRAIVSNDSLAPAVEQVVLGDADGAPAALVNRVDLRAALGAVLNVRARVERVSGKRLEVCFEEAWFAVSKAPDWLGGRVLGRRVRVPYPVPFAWLGGLAKGWLDVTYLDDGVRVSRGNRGSAFVLVRKCGGERLGGAEYLDGWED